MPKVHYMASAWSSPGDESFRLLLGTQHPIAPEQLRQRYGSRFSYLREFGRQLDHLVSNHQVNRDDAEELKLEEEKIRCSRGYPIKAGCPATFWWQMNPDTAIRIPVKCWNTGMLIRRQ